MRRPLLVPTLVCVLLAAGTATAAPTPGGSAPSSHDCRESPRVAAKVVVCDLDDDPEPDSVYADAHVTLAGLEADVYADAYRNEVGYLSLTSADVVVQARHPESGFAAARGDLFCYDLDRDRGCNFSEGTVAARTEDGPAGRNLVVVEAFCYEFGEDRDDCDGGVGAVATADSDPAGRKQYVGVGLLEHDTVVACAGGVVGDSDCIEQPLP